MQTIESISGQWEFQWTGKSKEDSSQICDAQWLPATVPGDVHLDLMANGLLDEPAEGFNSRRCAEAEDRAWFYRRTFTFHRPSAAFRARLVFEGLDCIAEVSLNGRRIGQTSNAFVPHAFDVTGALVDGENTVLVKITNGLEVAATKELKKYAGTKEEHLRIWLRKPQFSFGWDWAPRLITCGIWRDAAMHVTTDGFVDDLHARPVLSHGLGSATVNYSFRFVPVSRSGPHGEATVRILRGGCVVASEKVGLKAGVVRGKLAVENPDLWWPAGHGDQTLYELQVTTDGDDAPPTCMQFGIRKVRIVERPVRDGGKTFRFEINGRTIYCKGANWVPADLIVARAGDKKIDDLLEEAVCCNFNMLRIWGGGIYESDHFYRRCDELGIMIWQDFMYACALYPDDDEEFVANCTREAEAALKRMRNHPCIVVWCGNNEIHDGYDDVYSAMDGVDRFYGGRLWDEILPRLVRRLARGSLYRPGSPYGGKFHRSSLEGDCHGLMIGLARDDTTDIRIGVRSSGRFNNEFYTWNSPPDVESMRRYLGEADLHFASEGYLHHANTMFDTYEKAAAERYISAEIEEIPLEVYVGAMQRLQGEHLAAITDAHRRNIAFCGGSLFWMYNDCWPTSGWATHDYYLRRKALFYYMKRVFAPLTVSVREEDSGLSIWVSNLSGKAFEGTLRYGRYSFVDGKAEFEERKDVVVKAGASLRATFFHTSLYWPWEAISSFVHAGLCDTRGQLVAKASKLFSTYRGLSGQDWAFGPEFWAHRTVQKPAIGLKRLSDDSVEVTTDVPSFSIRLEADDALPDDNFFDLMPWEKKTVCFARPRPDGPLGVSSLNEVLLSLRDLTATPGQTHRVP